MLVYYKVIIESIRQAFSSLRGNKLRTFLSLLGIAIGIFCVISVLSAVNSLEQSIKGGLGELGSDVIVIDVFPWGEDPGDNFWKYSKRPVPTYNEYEDLKGALGNEAEMAWAAFVDGKTLKYNSSSVEGGFTVATSYDYPMVQNMNIDKGRYFTQSEYNTGRNKVILGNTMVTELFGNLEPIGKNVKIFGQRFQVVGTLEAEGDNPFNMFNYDEAIWISYNTAKKFINLKENNRMNGAKFVYLKAKEGVELTALKDNLTGELRRVRRLRPKEEDNFSLNELTMLDEVLDSIFGVMYIAGGFIGIFALIVGMVSVANIMFVSVKERTSIIGVKKALGAKKGIILLEFLIEAIILCLIGGFIGLSLVYVILKVLSSVLPIQIEATTTFMIIGVGFSILVGIISGIIPAYQASRMDPVDAMRQ